MLRSGPKNSMAGLHKAWYRPHLPGSLEDRCLSQTIYDAPVSHPFIMDSRRKRVLENALCLSHHSRSDRPHFQPGYSFWASSQRDGRIKFRYDNKLRRFESVKVHNMYGGSRPLSVLGPNSLLPCGKRFCDICQPNWWSDSLLLPARK